MHMGALGVGRPPGPRGAAFAWTGKPTSASSSWRSAGHPARRPHKYGTHAHHVIRRSSAGSDVLGEGQTTGPSGRRGATYRRALLIPRIRTDLLHSVTAGCGFGRVSVRSRDGS